EEVINTIPLPWLPTPPRSSLSCCCCCFSCSSPVRRRRRQLSTSRGRISPGTSSSAPAHLRTSMRGLPVKTEGPQASGTLLLIQGGWRTIALVIGLPPDTTNTRRMLS
ncbi:hypothetical protein EE612_029025, partial [Oryza sativa]